MTIAPWELALLLLAMGFLGTLVGFFLAACLAAGSHADDCAACHMNREAGLS